MRCLFAVCLAFLPAATFGQDEEREVPLPFVTLVQPPHVPEVEEVDFSEVQVREVQGLIRELGNTVERDDLYLNSAFGNPMFVPIGEFGPFGEWTGKRVEVPVPVRRLIELGPRVLPYLLASLDDDTSTKIVIEAVETRGAIVGGMAFEEILHGNPANPTERFTLKLNRFPYSTTIRPKDEFFVAPEMESYRVKVGDICLVIIGQITGRHYELLSTPHVKSSGILVCSPVHRKTVRHRVRRIWETKRPRQKLLESLVLDFSTRGMLQKENDGLDYWDIGNDFQIEAAKRLLYYFPDIARPLIANRIRSFQTSDDELDVYDNCIQNGVRTDHLVDAVAWSKDEDIKSTLTDLACRAKNRYLVDALQRAGVKIPERE
jgi:hypothetical protein